VTRPSPPADSWRLTGLERDPRGGGWFAVERSWRPPFDVRARVRRMDADGTLAKYGVEMIGAKPAAISKGEDRELFKQAMLKIGLDVARSRTVKSMAEALAGALSGPVFRPYYADDLIGAETGGALKNVLANAPFRVGIAPFPAGPEGRVTLATTDAYGIWEGTEHPDEAWALMKFLLDDDYVLAQAEAQFLQPARASLVPAWADIIRAEYPEETQDLDIEAFADGQRGEAP
jgi:hypothetical protein